MKATMRERRKNGLSVYSSSCGPGMDTSPLQRCHLMPLRHRSELANKRSSPVARACACAAWLHHPLAAPATATAGAATPLQPHLQPQRSGPQQARSHWAVCLTVSAAANLEIHPAPVTAAFTCCPSRLPTIGRGPTGIGSSARDRLIATTPHYVIWAPGRR